MQSLPVKIGTKEETSRRKRIESASGPTAFWVYSYWGKRAVWERLGSFFSPATRRPAASPTSSASGQAEGFNSRNPRGKMHILVEAPGGGMQRESQCRSHKGSTTPRLAGNPAQNPGTPGPGAHPDPQLCPLHPMSPNISVCPRWGASPGCPPPAM